MCGIAGFYSVKKPLSDQHEQVLMRMLYKIEHRGPDEFGVYLSDHVGLANARLSIIDLGSGSQPISNEDQTIWIVYNGEIFNFRELRNTLEAQGHQFKTQSDTEVVVHLYEQHGYDCLSLLNGQFAFVIYDSNKKEIFAARDRFGIRPFYYNFQEDKFIFASELKALFQALEHTPGVDFESLNSLFTFWTTIPPKTIFEGIFELLPGHYLTLSKSKGLEIQRYWQLAPGEDETKYGQEEALKRLEELLRESVNGRSYADVPVAAYLSGGLDSSITTALLKEQSHSLHTFSMAFEHEDFDESAYQEIALKALNTNHHQVTIKNDDIPRYFKDTIAHTESPLLRTSPIPLFLLSKLVHEHNIKVVLTGEGADEIFAGYNIFKEALIRRFWSRVPDSKYRPLLLQRLYPYLRGMSGSKTANLSLFFGYRLEETDRPLYSHLLRWKNTSRVRQFLTPEVKRSFEMERAEQQVLDLLPKDYAKCSLLDRAQLLEITLFMSNYLLSSQGDRMAMAHSVEGRYPFLDHRVAEFALSLPSKLRVHGMNEKHILKKFGAKLLPEKIALRRKHPYRAPITPLIDSDNSGELKTYLEGDQLRQHGLFSEKAVGKLLKKIDAGAEISETENMALIGVLSTQCLMELVKDFRQPVQDFNSSIPVKRVHQNG